MDTRPRSHGTSARRPPRTADSSVAPSTAGGMHDTARVEYEVEPRVRRIEQQLQEKLPTAWRVLAGAPMRIQYYDKTINTFRENPHIKPSESYIRHAVKQLRQQLEREKLGVLTDQELREIVCKEWRTDMTRCVWQARLNRHGSRDGPVVRRSKSGVITVTAQPTAKEANYFVIDAMAQEKKAVRKTKS